MKVLIDRSRCTGNARCNAVAPELFDLDDDGYVVQSEVSVPSGLEDRARNAANSCPEQVITVVIDSEV
jgi:ferredoxin